MGDDFVQVAPDSTGKKVDNTTETTAVGTVERQRVSLAAVGSNNQLAIDGTGKIGVSNFPATQPISSTDGSQITVGTTTDLDTANTVIGRLKQIITTLQARLPAALVGGRLDVNLGDGNAGQGTAAVASGAWPVKVTDGTNVGAVKAASTAAVATDPAVVVAQSPNSPTPVGANRIGSVRVVDSADADQTTVKGTQTARFFGTQDAKDSGRVNIMWTAEVAGAATTEGLLTVTESRDGAATTTFTTKVVTTGKRLRITSAFLAVEALGTGTTPQRVYVRLRFNTAGAVVAGSPLQTTWAIASNQAQVKATAATALTFPDGIEFLGDGTKQIGLTIQFPDWVVTTGTVQAKLSITAFEY